MLLFTCIYSVTGYAEGKYYFMKDNVRYENIPYISIDSSLLFQSPTFGLQNPSSLAFSTGDTYEVMDSSTNAKVGRVVLVTIGGARFALSEGDAPGVSTTFKDAFVVGSNNSLTKASGFTALGSESLNDIYKKKAKNLSSALKNYFAGDMNNELNLSNDLGVASTVNGNATGMQWWGINDDTVLESSYKTSKLTKPQTVFITTDVPGSTTGEVATYSIFLPPAVVKLDNGDFLEVNESTLQSVVNFIFGNDGYKKKVKTALLECTIEYGVNVFSVSSENLIKLSDVLEDKDGKKAIVNNKQGVSTSLNYFIHPGFGVMSSPPLTKEDWLSDDMFRRLTNIASDGQPLNSSMPKGFVSAQNPDGSTTGNLTLKISQDYKNFIKNRGTSYPSLTEYTGTVGDGAVKPIREGSDASNMKNYSDTKLRIVLPSMFAKDAGGAYQLSSNADKYYSFVNFYYDVSDNNLYYKDNNAYKALYNLSDVFVDDKDLYLHRASLQDIDGFSVQGDAPCGVIVMGKFLEALVVPTGDASEVQSTGRFIKTDLKNTVSNFSTVDENFMKVYEWDSSSPYGVALQIVGFPVSAVTGKNVGEHQPLKDNENIRLVYTKVPTVRHVGNNATTSAAQTVQDTSLEGQKIFFAALRNNTYIQDQKLSQWVKGGKISNTYADVDRLKQLLNGGLNSKKLLTYEEWKRMQEVKNQLADKREKSWTKYITVPTMIFGVLLILYAILLWLAYWIDVFNVFTEFSFLHFMTFKKVYPVMNEDEMKYYNSGGNVKYVTKKWVLKTSIICVCIGALFISYMDLLQLLLNVYYWVTDVTGGVIK